MTAEPPSSREFGESAVKTISKTVAKRHETVMKRFRYGGFHRPWTRFVEPARNSIKLCCFNMISSTYTVT